MASSRRTCLAAAALATIALFSLGACATAAEEEGSAAPPASSTNGSPTLPAPDSKGKDSGCATSADCPAPPACEEAACIDHKCVQRAIKCEGGDECAPNACDPATSKCVTTPKADRTACDKGFGQCIAGACEKVESCFGDSPMQYLHCDGTTYRDLSTSLYTKSRVGTYACASGQIANEVALELDPPAGANVTLSLSVTDAADADLDLIVLESQCDGLATCAGQSLTAGTGSETVSFTAKSTKYYVVIDGKVAAPTKFRINAACN